MQLTAFDKPRVERAMPYVRDSFWSGRIFTRFEEIVDAALACPVTVEAKKTVAFEIWEQLGRGVPDVVVVPAGDGPTLNGMAKGFRELVDCGAIDHVPRLIGVQAEGCQPIKRAWETGDRICPAIPATIADGIAVGDPVAGAMAVRDVLRSGGCFVSVSDDKMLDAMGLLATCAGVLAEPAAAAALAGVLVAIELRLVSPDERLVVLVTGRP